MPTTKLEIPARISGLESLARNLRWSWVREARSLFVRLDPDAWSRTHHNPVALLTGLDAGRLAGAAADPGFVEAVQNASADLEAYLAARTQTEPRRVAYFSAEFAITDSIRVFSGGLGVLAGDHLKSASDLGLPLVGVGLLYRDGYFRQQVDGGGWQRESYRRLEPETLPLLPELAPDGSPLLVGVEFPGRTVYSRVWRADVGAVPLYLLDTHVEANAPDDHNITDRLYGGDIRHRLEQELVLGIGGVRALAALGHPIETYHLNEGHAAFAVVERLGTAVASAADPADALRAVSDQVIFTTHTPVEAGHDYFPTDLMEPYFRARIEAMGMPWDRFMELGRTADGHRPGQFCMTALALRCARSSNGVSELHGRVSRAMWRGLYGVSSPEEVPIGHVTNGVHLPTWAGPDMSRLFSRHLAVDWRDGRVDWEDARRIPLDALWEARQAQRARLVDHLRRALAAQARDRGTPDVSGSGLDPDALTITFARRFATYKRATLLVSDLDRLERIAGAAERPVQFIFAGKAHPHDEPGKQFIQRIFAASRRPGLAGRLVFVENYDVELARYLVRGSDVWLNVPRRPLEASGTSGMKAAANGGLNLSVADGWWAQAWHEHNNGPAPIGWVIESGGTDTTAQDDVDADTLYRLLENEVIPLFYERNGNGIPVAWLERTRAAIAQVCPFFNTNRMVAEYAEAYRLPTGLPVS